MGIFDSKNKKISNLKFIIDRIISVNTEIGITKIGETLKFKNSYYPFHKLYKMENKLIFHFYPNIFLTIEQTDRIIDDYFVLFFILESNKEILDIGEIKLVYKRINFNAPNLDAIYHLQIT